MEVKEWLNSDLGIDIWNKKYRYDDESFDRWLDRVSDNDLELRTLILEKKFLFGGRALSNRNTDGKSSYFNCYSSGYCPDDFKGILEVNSNLGLTYKAQGGQGVSLSKLRPKGTSIGGRYSSDGILPFLELFNKTTEITSQGGSRKGALLVSLDIRHKEAEDFITIKTSDNTINKANLSLEIDDDFMGAVQAYYTDGIEAVMHEKREYSGHVIEYDIIPIKLYKLMMKSAYDWAEPACIFTERFRNYNLMELDDDYQIETCNPCLHPDTIIETTSGKMKIKDIKEPVKVYSMDDDNNLIIKQASASILTKKDSEILEITINNGNILRVTKNHKVYIKNKGWVEAKDLKVGDVPVALLRRRRGCKYSGVRLSTQAPLDSAMEHRMVYESHFGKIQDGYDIHHIDGDSYNNRYLNLKLLKHSEHATLTRYSCDNDHMINSPINGRFISNTDCKTNKKMIKDLPCDLKTGFKSTPRIIEIKNGLNSDVYDISVEDTHNFIADGIIVHNCGEQPLAKDFCCNLGSLNLSEFIINPYSKNAEIDYNSLSEAIKVAIKSLDVLVDENADYHPLEVQKKNSLNYRNIGLGVMGYGTALFKLGITYGSKKCMDFTDKLFSYLFTEAVICSSNLAKEKGSFPKYKDCVFDSEIIKNHFSPTEISSLKKQGIRNCSLLSIAPTGSIGTMLGVTGGCEPEFALKFTRKTESLNNGEIGYYEVDCDAIREYRYITGKSDTPSYFVASADIKWKDRVDVQSIMQRHIDTAISSTVNLKKDCSLDDVEALYLYAWRKGIKGITIYRSGCKREGILTVKDGDSEYKYEELPRGFIEDVPEGLIYRKYKLKTGCGNLYFFVGVDEFDGKIYDCFTNTDGVGGCTINTQANSRLLSAALRGGVPVEYLVDQLNKSGTCPSFQYKRGRGEDVSKGKSCSSAIAFVLKDILEEFKNDESEDKVVKSISQNTNNDCPECGEKVIYEGGCNICKSCGWSKCS